MRTCTAPARGVRPRVHEASRGGLRPRLRPQGSGRRDRYATPLPPLPSCPPERKPARTRPFRPVGFPNQIWRSATRTLAPTLPSSRTPRPERVVANASVTPSRSISQPRTSSWPASRLSPCRTPPRSSSPILARTSISRRATSARTALRRAPKAQELNPAVDVTVVTVDITDDLCKKHQVRSARSSPIVWVEENPRKPSTPTPARRAAGARRPSPSRIQSGVRIILDTPMCIPPAERDALIRPSPRRSWCARRFPGRRLRRWMRSTPTAARSSAAGRGVFGSLFCDFGPQFDVHDVDGEERASSPPSPTTRRLW